MPSKILKPKLNKLGLKLLLGMKSHNIPKIDGNNFEFGSGHWPFGIPAPDPSDPTFATGSALTTGPTFATSPAFASGPAFATCQPFATVHGR